MKIVFDEFTSKDSDYLLVARTFDDDGNEIESLPFYVNSDIETQDPAFKKSIEGIPSLLARMYELGKDGVEVSFENTGVKVV